ncbi:MAG: phospholipase D family protein [Acidimicrobiales bacterium]
MLRPDDRAVLREQLRRPPGWELDAAVATSFTLDLTAALVAPLAFASYEVSGDGDPVAVLEAIRRSADRVDIFCQAGQIRVPAKASDLMAFLEPMVHSVTAPLPGTLFHPKVWVVRYLSPDGEKAFRLICATRNLTDDVSWDALVSLDGQQYGRRPIAASRPLVDLIALLPRQAVHKLPGVRQQRIASLVEDLRTVEWDAPEGVSSVDFHALGLRTRRGDSSLVEALEGKRHLVVSPFLDDEAIGEATKGSQHTTLVSRPEAFERLRPETLAGLDHRIVSPMASLHHPDDSDSESDEERGTSSVDRPGGGLLGGLHAKLYVVESGHHAHLFLGSANCTTAGLTDRNVEFVVQLTAGKKTLGLDRFLDAETGLGGMLEHYEPRGGVPETPEETLERELERHLRRIAAQPLTAHITADGEHWAETVSGVDSLALPPDSRLTARLLTVEGRASEQASDRLEAHFDGLPLADVTPFVVLTLGLTIEGVRGERATVVRAGLRGDPPGRLDEVIARQVDTPEKFLRFVALLLGLAEGAMGPIDGGNGSGAGWVFGHGSSTGLFELMANALADKPEVIDDLDRLVTRLASTETGRKTLPDGFEQLWSIVREARTDLGPTP